MTTSPLFFSLADFGTLRSVTLVASHCEELARADGIIIVHPNWWGAPPAVLKGWVDRVFRPEVAYRFLEGDTGEGRYLLAGALISGVVEPLQRLIVVARGKSVQPEVVVRELPQGR